MQMIETTSPAKAFIAASKLIIAEGVTEGDIIEVLNLGIVITGFDNGEYEKKFDEKFRTIFGEDRIDFASKVTFIEPKKKEVDGLFDGDGGEEYEYTCLPRDDKRDSYWGRLIGQCGGQEFSGRNQIERLIAKLNEDKAVKTAHAVIFAPKDLFNPYSMPCMSSINVIPRNGNIHLSCLLRSNAISKSGYADYSALVSMGNYLANRSNLKLNSVTVLAHTAHLRKQNRELAKTKQIIAEME